MLNLGQYLKTAFRKISGFFVFEIEEIVIELEVLHNLDEFFNL
ncbi:hypothetical protein FLAN108750_09000 [Flavobacterium antarcticum]